MTGAGCGTGSVPVPQRATIEGRLAMFWMAGYVGHGRHRAPADRTSLPDDATANLWVVGDPPRRWARTASGPLREVLVIGVCGASDAEAHWLARNGVPDDVTWRWPGAYVVVERTDAATTIWTDLANAAPVYVTAADDGMYWSTSARALAGLAGRSVDLERVSAELLAPGTPVLAGSRTYFEGVELLPAGHRIRISHDGVVRTARVWWPATRPVPDAMGLRDELDVAVGVRVDDTLSPSSDLSGGLDSTALTVLAARRLSPDRSVAAFTVHAPYDEPAGDLTYALDAAQHPGVRHHLLQLEPHHLPYGRLDRIPATDEPAPSTIANARFAYQLDAMTAKVASSAHLTGDGGDSLLTTPDAWIADLLATHRYAEAFDEAVRLGRLRRCSPATLLRQAVDLNRTDPGQALLDWATLARGMSTSPARTRRATNLVSNPRQPTWATPDARVLAAAFAEQAARRPDLARPRGARAVWDVVEQMTEVGRTAQADAQLAHAHDVVLHNPFADSRVIDIYLSATAGRMLSPAAFKPILRAAMDGVLPLALLAPTTKGVYAPDFHYGLRVHRSTLTDLIDGHLAAAGLVDPATFVSALHWAASGINAGIWLLDAAITVEAWLRAHHAAGLPVWKPAVTSVVTR